MENANTSAVLKNLRQQAYWCGELGSRFTCLLLLKAAEDVKTGGPVARLFGGWTGNPATDAAALRLAGALHAAVLTGRDPALAALYPAASPDWSMENVWPAALDFLRREEDWVRGFLQSPPQTNETGRAMGLAAAFMWLAARAPQPFHLLELGSSAGLNLNWDAFRYKYEPWGRAQGDGPVIPTRINGGPLPEWRDIAIASRAGCDQNPFDIRDMEARLRLRAYVWPDQTARLERLDAAIALALARDTGIERADAADWIATKLSGPLPQGTTVVYHSVFLQYPPRAVRDAIAAAIETAGDGAAPAAQLAWVRFEPAAVIGARSDSGQGMVLNVVRWDGAGRTETTLADVDPHGRFMEWRG